MGASRKERFVFIVFGWWLLLLIVLVGLIQFINSAPISPEQFIISWDSNWYNSIIQHGYQPGAIISQANVAFFPLYPIIVGIIGGHFLPTFVAAFIVSASCFLGSLLLLYRFVYEKYDEHVACWTVLLAVFNPWSFYFAMMYTESLFLLLTVATCYLLYRRQFWWAASIAGLATATRSPGIILALIVSISWVVANTSQLRKVSFYVRTLLLGIVSVSGLLAFMTFLYFNNHDALAFVHVQHYWPGREGGRLFHEISLLLKHFLSGQLTLEYLIMAMWDGATALGILGTAIWIKRKEYVFATFVGLGVLLPLSSGSVVSMSRYIIVLFPLYILGALYIYQKSRTTKLIMMGISVMGLVMMLHLLTRSSHPFLG